MSETITAAEFRARFVDKDTPKQGTPKKSKYNATKTERHGLKFDSKKEADRFDNLMLMFKAKVISRPVLQYEFELVGCVYRCDFFYFDYSTKQFVVEDVKSDVTRKLSTYRIKKKQMKELYGIEIKET